MATNEDAASAVGVSAGITSQPSPKPTPQKSEAEGATNAEIKAYGISLRVPLPKWAIAALAAALIVGLVTLGGYLTYSYVLNSVPVSRTKLNEYAENSKHSLEQAELKESLPVVFSDGTRVTINHFKSDGCNQIVRWIPAISKADGLWMFGPKLTPDKQSAIASNRSSESERASTIAPVASMGLTEPEGRTTRPKLAYIQYSQVPRTYKEVQYGPHCLDPHPGPWSERPQQVAQCAVQVWRYFGDGCVHFQWFNPCTGTWDVYPNGAPRVNWQRCVH